MSGSKDKDDKNDDKNNDKNDDRTQQDDAIGGVAGR